MVIYRNAIFVSKSMIVMFRLTMFNVKYSAGLSKAKHIQNV